MKATTQATPLKTKVLTITFGTLTFSITQDEANNQPQQEPTLAGAGRQREEKLCTTPPRVISNKNHATGTYRTTEQYQRFNNKGKQEAKRYKENIQTKQPTTVPRFIKVPQATTEWQKVVNKPKSNKGKSKKCYHCHKAGHIRKYCWGRLKCFTCGRAGHKFAKCPLKKPATPQANTPTQPLHQKPNPDMEPARSRPPLADIFSPPRQTLSADNDYLGTVGLIILIRGCPHPDFPRLAAEKLASVHGGHRTDYEVTQATITPYLVTCRSSCLRDTVVQTGIYSIPQAQVQFTIHEWRPRFGMGFDPSTHQVWVRIIGLPLQAWTTEEISDFLRHFGHPIQILPFGQAAGHYRDITAMVATKSPSRIPLAYTYREGEYATKVDIVILRSRRWEEGYFPPPEDNMPRRDRNSQVRSRCYEALPSIPTQPSSPTLSTGTPSEPTIDLSAWSPRSYKIIPLPDSDSKFRLNQPLQILRERHHGTQSSQSTMWKFLPTTGSHERPPWHTYGDRHISATQDPSLLKNLLQILSLIRVCLTTVPNPIAINSLHFLRTVDGCSITWGEARKDAATVPCLTLSLLKYRSQRDRSIGVISERELLTDTTFNPKIGQHSSLQVVQMTGPPKPNMPTHGASQNLLDQGRSQAISTLPAQPPLLFPTQVQDLEASLDLNPKEVTSSEARQSIMVPDQSQTQPQTSCLATENLLTTIANTPETTGVTFLAGSALDSSSLQRKQTSLPTRRSQRLLTKRQKTQPTSEFMAKTKSKVCKLPFEKDSHLVALDTSKTLQILQATGLFINKQIEEMIDEAVKNDRVMEDAEQARPITPLHDPIPPLAIPGTDLFL